MKITIKQEIDVLDDDRKCCDYDCCKFIEAYEDSVWCNLFDCGLNMGDLDKIPRCKDCLQVTDE